jgi:hypothetical protein
LFQCLVANVNGNRPGVAQVVVVIEEKIAALFFYQGKNLFERPVFDGQIDLLRGTTGREWLAKQNPEKQKSARFLVRPGHK